MITPIPSSLLLDLTSTWPSLDDAKAALCSNEEEVVSANIAALMLVVEYFMVVVVVFDQYACTVVWVFGYI